MGNVACSRGAPNMAALNSASCKSLSVNCDCSCATTACNSPTVAESASSSERPTAACAEAIGLDWGSISGRSLARSASIGTGCSTDAVGGVISTGIGSPFATRVKPCCSSVVLSVQAAFCCDTASSAPGKSTLIASPAGSSSTYPDINPFTLPSRNAAGFAETIASIVCSTEIPGSAIDEAICQSVSDLVTR